MEKGFSKKGKLNRAEGDNNKFEKQQKDSIFTAKLNK
jgi:hypothetical protein